MAKIVWTFNKEKSTISAGNATPFSFELERYKDANTFEETLKISSLLKGEANGFIVTTIYNLGKDIKQLKKYGVVLSDIDFIDLQKAIENNYLKLKIESVNLEKDSKDHRFEDLIASVKEFVDGNVDLITNDLCYVPVNEFNGLVKDCKYYEYEMKALREQLATQGYIQTPENRYTKVVRIKGKGVRAIAFKRDKLGVAVPVSKKDKQSKKSGADE